MSPATAWDTRRNNFGPLRLLLAIAVVVSHSFYLTTGVTAHEPFYVWTGQTLGQHAVEAFFVISGLLITGSLSRTASLRDFARARLARIMPALLACVVVTALMVGPLATSLPLLAYFADGDVLLYVIRTASLSTGNAPLPHVFAGLPVPGAVNVPLYTLKYEVGCYGLLALTAWFGILRHRMVMTALGLALVAGFAVQQAFHQPGWEGSFGLWPRFLACFALGMLAWLWHDRLVLQGRHLLLIVGLYLMALAVDLHGGIGPIVTAAAIVWAANWHWPTAQRVTTHTDVSYGVYIWGWLVQQCMVAAVPGITVLPHLALSLAVLLPLAWLSWVLVEKPSLAWARSAAGRPQTHGPGATVRAALSPD